MAKLTSKILTGTTELKIRFTYYGQPAPVLAVYEYELNSPDSNAPLESHRGDNQNSEDDLYTLPSPSEQNKGRYAFIRSTIAAIDADSSFTVKTEILQNGKVSDTLVSPGTVKAHGDAVQRIDVIEFA
ncbi:MAG: hypothetical protein ACJ77K_07800 [Bacteroidia bacterium]